MKFLEKEELSNFHFQLEFLKPFQLVMGYPTSTETIRELITQIIANMIQTQQANIRSGWKVVLSILAMAAAVGPLDERDEVPPAAANRCSTAFKSLRSIVTHSFASVVKENFADTARSLTAFCLATAIPDMPDEALGLLNKLAVNLLEEEQAEPPADRDAFMGRLQIFWFPLLSELAQLASNAGATQVIRVRACNALFEHLQAFGGTKFEVEHWGMFYKGIILPLIDDCHAHVAEDDGAPASSPPSTEVVAPHADGAPPPPPPPDQPNVFWAVAICGKVYSGLIELFASHFASLRLLLPEVTVLFRTGIVNQPVRTSRLCIGRYRTFIADLGQFFDERDWLLVCNSIDTALHNSSPDELVNASFAAGLPETPTDPAMLPFDPLQALAKCSTQRLVVDLINGVFAKHFEILPLPAVSILLHAANRSFSFAYGFNQRVALRHKLKCAGFMREMKELPGLLKQQRESLRVYLEVLVRYLQCYRERTDPEMPVALRAEGAREFFETGFLEACDDSLEKYGKAARLRTDYAARNGGRPRGQEAPRTFSQLVQVELERDLTGWNPIVSQTILGAFAHRLTDDFFASAMPRFYPKIADLVLVEYMDVRTAVRDLLLTRFGYPAPAPPEESPVST
eukprot:Polyplicarium_translucidae@DN3059_c0_g2_i2.p1